MASISRFKKLLLGTALSLSLIIPVLPVNAQAVAENQGMAVTTSVQPRAAICPQCGTGRLVTQTTHTSSWSSGKGVSCIHGYAYGNDVIQTRTISKETKCSNSKCTYLYNSDKTEARRLCHGTNNP